MVDQISQKSSQIKIGQRMEELRKKTHMTQSELANKLGTSQSAVARMEAGGQNFTTQMLGRIGQILGNDILVAPAKEESIHIQGYKPLKGVVEIQGAKNSVLPAIAASLLPEKGTTTIKNVPHINDVSTMLEIASNLGAKVDYDEKEKIVVINAENLSSSTIPAHLANKIRASLLFLAPLVVRLGRAQLPAVGGCQIGERKTDFHYRGFTRMKADVRSNERFEIDIKSSRLQGNYLYLDTPSHTGTENLMMAACLAKGETILDNAASDPEVVDLANMLIKMGAKISGIGTRTIHITGVDKLEPTEHKIIPDRHDFSAFAVAVAITGGKATLKNVVSENQRLFEAKLKQMGVQFKHTPNETTVIAPTKISPINIITYPYPGYPTDSQPSITALSVLATGRSFIRETVFENRFGYIEFLNEMGADIVVSKNDVLMIDGVKWLDGATVRAEDIRSGFGLVSSALAAQGKSIIENSYQIERGHEYVVERLGQLGAQITKK